MAGDPSFLSWARLTIPSFGSTWDFSPPFCAVNPSLPLGFQPPASKEKEGGMQPFLPLFFWFQKKRKRKRLQRGFAFFLLIYPSSSSLRQSRVDSKERISTIKTYLGKGASTLGRLESLDWSSATCGYR